MSKEMSRANELKNLLEYYDDMYYNSDVSLVSDAEYDSIKSDYLALTGQQEYSYVPGMPQAEFGRYTHEFPIRSLAKVNDEETLTKELRRLAPGIIQPKYDGLTVVFYPNKERGFTAVTRGNGETGEDITATVSAIEGIKDLPWDKTGWPVRAEGYMKISDFNAINMDRVSKGEDPFLNPRNAAAGMLRNKDINKVKGISMVCYDLVGSKINESTKLNTLYRMGIPVPDPTKCFKYTIDTIDEAVEWIKNFDREGLDYEIDGLVVKSNIENSLGHFGETGHHPKNAVAWKFKSQGAWTTLNRVVYQTGRTGKLTPVAEFEPVEILGSVVSRATLHNESIMKALGINTKCEVYVIKANDVIPAITHVRNANGLEYPEPIVCPACGGSLEKRNELHFCMNPLCKEKLLANVVHFAKRDALDIDGLAEGTVQKMIEAGLLRVPTDIFNVTEDQIRGLEGFAAKSAKKLFNDIQKGCSAPLHKFIYASGMPNVGRRMSKDIAEEFRTFADLMADIKTGGSRLRTIDGVGEISVENIIKYHPLLGLLYMHVTPEDAIKVESSVYALKGTSYTFVVTGVLSQPRSEIERILRDAGHTVSSSVSMKTDYLVAGDKTGASKYNAATAKGVKIITEEQLWSIIG